MASQPVVDQGLLIVEASLARPDTIHLVGLLWTSDQPHEATSTWQHTHDTQETNIYAPIGFEPAKAASWRPQTHALDTAATEIGEGHPALNKSSTMYINVALNIYASLVRTILQ
jgi:hypothetical protein